MRDWRWVRRARSSFEGGWKGCEVDFAIFW